MTFDSLGLAPEYLRAVADEGYTEPTPVQRQAIPLVLDRRDLLAGAQTGTGKTAAFVLPILQLLHDTRQRPTGGGAPVRTPIRALVLAPTRELALQVEASVRVYGKHRPVRSVPIYGGVGFDPQVRALRAGAEIVIATPGRLLDHVGRRTIDLSQVEILVLDEADRMLDLGFIRDIRRILGLLPPSRQNLLFSATFSDDIRELASGLLHDPATVDVAPRNTAAELVEQVVIPVDRERKRELLAHLVGSGRIERALVFTRTKHGANRLAQQLERDGIGAAAIHGNKSQGARVRALDDFKTGRVGILVATDIAARGIDIDALPHVVNFELPMVPADYIHRIGRTGRAGVGGNAVSLVSVDEAELLRDIQRHLRTSIPSETIEGFEPDRSIRPEPINPRAGRPPMGGGRGPRQGAPRQGGPRHGAPRPGGQRPAGQRPAVVGARPGSTIGAHAPVGHATPGQAASHKAYGSRPPGGRPGGPAPDRAHRPHRNHARPAAPVALPGERIRRAESSTQADRPTSPQAKARTR